MQRWEYTRVHVDLSMSDEKLGGSFSTFYEYKPVGGPQTEEAWAQVHELGRQGWELVSALPVTSALLRPESGAAITKGYLLLFKRPLQPSPPSDIQPPQS